MKKICSLFLSLIMVFCLCSCTPTSTVDVATLSSLKYVGDRDLKAKYDEYYSIFDIFDDISNVNLSMEMGSISGYELVTEVGENGASIDYYYRNDDCVYVVFNGYSENLWKYYTTSTSGTNIVVSYWDEGDNKCVEIVTNDEDVSVPYDMVFTNIDSTLAYGAQKVDITITDGDEQYTYTVEDNIYYVSYASYWDDSNNLHRFEAEYNSDSQKVDYHYDDIVISGTLPEEDETEDLILAAGLRSENLKGVNILLGEHEIYKNPDGKMFINAEATLIFETQEDADATLQRLKLVTVNANDFTVAQDKGETYYIINIGTCLLGISDSFEKGNSILEKYASDEFSEYVYKTVEFDENLDITSIEDGIISYY